MVLNSTSGGLIFYSMATELHWFPLYWQRFTIGTLDFNTEEVGAYIRLLIYAWDKGFVPENDKELKRISGVSVKKLEKVLKKFKKIDGKYFNDTLENIREEQREKSVSYSNRGKNGASARWHKDSSSNAQAMHKQCLSNGIREEKNKEEQKREKVITPTHFDRFFATEADRMLVIKYTTSLGIKYHDVRFKLYIEAYDASFAMTHENGDYNKWKQYLKYFFENGEYKKVKIPYEHQEKIVYR